jgi:lysozyme
MNKLNQKGYDLITKFEGFRAKPYLDSVNVPTIGYGSTFYQDGAKVTMKDKAISKEYATKLFTIVADEFASKVSRLIKKEINQNQFNSLVSLSYNIGIGAFRNSSLLKMINENPNNPMIKYKFLAWNKGLIKGEKVAIVGLTNRRKLEAENYFKKI